MAGFHEIDTGTPMTQSLDTQPSEETGREVDTGAPPPPPPKTLAQKSEAWLSAIAATGTLLTAYLSHIENAATYIAIGVCVALAGVFAFFKTPLASKKKPGVRTKTFWVSIVVVLGSVATAIAEADIAGLPAKVTQIAGMASAAVTALGYNIWRVVHKKNGGG